MAFLKFSGPRRILLLTRTLWAAGVLALALLGAAGTEGRAQTPAPTEYQVKAIFLFNFAQFVEWPPKAFPAAQAPIVIGVLGQDPFGTYLDEAVLGELVGTHPLVVRRFKRGENITACHILFVSRSEAGQFAAIVPRLRSLGVLTVGDFDGFIHQGGMIRFVTVNNKIRLRVNVEATRAAGLTISSKLLRPAMVAQDSD